MTLAIDNLVESNHLVTDDGVDEYATQQYSVDSPEQLYGMKQLDEIQEMSKVTKPKTDLWHKARKVDHERAKRERPILDCLFPGFRLGRVGGLVSAGGTGKSMLALELAIAVACPLKEANLLGLEIPKHGRVVYFSGEDDLEEFESRLHSIHKVLDMSGKGDEILAFLKENLEIIDLEESPRDFLNPLVFAKICEWAKGARLVVIDTLSMFHSADENSNTEMAKVISLFKLLAKRIGCCVIFLHHTNKSMAKDGRQDEQQSTRGASVLVDNSRFIAYLSGMSKTEYERQKSDNNGPLPFSEDERSKWVSFGASKQNGGGRFDPFWLVRVEGGVLVRKAANFWGVMGSDFKGGTPSPIKPESGKRPIKRVCI